MGEAASTQDVLTPERFLTEHYPRLPVPVFAPEEKRGSHMTAFREACRIHGLEFRQAGERRFEIVRAGIVIGRLNGMRTDLVSRGAVTICGNKAVAIPHLARAGVPVPEQRAFDGGGLEEALDFARHRSFDVVVKLAVGSGGRGVTTAIRDEADFRLAWSHALDHQPPGQPPQILVESKCPGIDLRALVVAGRFSCAVTRVPANVIGDGASTVDALIVRKNAVRATRAYHANHPIIVGERLLRRLAARDMSLDTVLAAGAPLILGEVSNVHDGGDACEVTGLVPENIREIAERGARAVPGLGVVGIDLMVSGLDGNARVAVIEMNTAANFRVHHAPYLGEPRNPAIDVVQAMIDAGAPQGEPRL